MLWTTFLLEKVWVYTINHFYVMGPEFVEIMQNKGHYTIQGHSKSPILVPIKRLHMTS